MNLIERIETLYIKGEYDKVLSILEQTTTNTSSLSDQEQMYLLYYQSRCKSRIGKYQEAINIAQEGEKKFQNNQSNYGFFALELALCASYIEIGNLDDAERLIAVVERSKSFLYESLRGKKLLATAYNNITAVRQRKGEPDSENISLLTKALTLNEEIGNNLGVAFNKLNIGAMYNNSGDYSTALKYVTESIPILEESGNTYYIAGGYEQLGEFYGNLAELDKSLEYLQKALRIKKENGFQIYQTLGSIGYVYLMKGDDLTAEKYLYESLDLAEKNKNVFEISSVLLLLFNLYQYKKDTNSMKKILDEIKALPDSDLTNSVKLLSEGLYYLEQDQMRDKLKSIQYFENVIAISDKTMYFLRFNALCSLCEVNILELKITPSEDTLNNTIDLVNQLYNYSKEQNAPEPLIKSLILMSRLSLINGSVEKAELQINEALEIATKKGIPYLIKNVEKEKDKLIADVKKWQSLISSNSSLVERIQLSEFEDYVKNAKQMASFFT